MGGWMLVLSTFILAFSLSDIGIVYIVRLHFFSLLYYDYKISYNFGQTRVDILMIKHVLLFIIVIYGLYFHFKLKKQLRNINN